MIGERRPLAPSPPGNPFAPTTIAMPPLPSDQLALGFPPPAVALAGVRQPGEANPREPIEWASRAGFRAVTLDASAPGLRPRDLDRSARRDLASLLRRLELSFCGLDLWIPPEHFADAAHADRAASATTQAITLCAELSRDSGAGVQAVSIALPRAVEGERARGFGEVLATIVGAADGAGVLLADHSWPVNSGAQADSPLRVGLDPASLLLRGEDPVTAAASLGARVAVARWTNADSLTRVAPDAPAGRLDVASYVGVLRTTTRVERLVVDLRGLAHPREAASAVVLNTR